MATSFSTPAYISPHLRDSPDVDTTRGDVTPAPSARRRAVIPSSPEVIPCQHPHAERLPKSNPFPGKNEFAAELTSCTPNAATNPARSSTTGFKPKMTFVEPRSKPSTKRLKSLSQPATRRPTRHRRSELSRCAHRLPSSTLHVPVFARNRRLIADALAIVAAILAARCRRAIASGMCALLFFLFGHKTPCVLQCREAYAPPHAKSMPRSN